MDMSEYKKDTPIEHLLAEIISMAEDIIADDLASCSIQNRATDIITCARKIWDAENDGI